MRAVVVADASHLHSTVTPQTDYGCSAVRPAPAPHSQVCSIRTAEEALP